MNWGKKIAILYIGFVLMIVFLVLKSNHENTDLVSADYYAQELKFQDKIDGQNNMNALSGQVQCEARNKTVNITFPQELFGKNTTGEILFYRPSDATLDLSSKLEMDAQGNQVIHSENFKRGIYRMQLKCVANSKSYYYEQQIFMN